MDALLEKCIFMFYEAQTSGDEHGWEGNTSSSKTFLNPMEASWLFLPIDPHIVLNPITKTLYSLQVVVFSLFQLSGFPVSRSTVALSIRKVQYSPSKLGRQPCTIVRKDFMLSPGELELEATLDKQVRNPWRKDRPPIFRVIDYSVQYTKVSSIIKSRKLYR